MALKDVWVKRIGQHRGRPRIFFDGLQAIRSGFSPGERFSVEVDGHKVVITANADGSRTVSSRRRKDRTLPVLDINSHELSEVFAGMDAVRVVVTTDRVFLLPLASEARKVERLERLKTKLIEGRPLAAGSLAHGGGVLAHAIHQGLKDGQIECGLKFANELRDDLLLHAIDHNDSWSDSTAALAVPMQELAQDEWLMGQLPRLEILEMGLPCSGASLAGHTKKGLSMMEQHEQVGHLVYSALAVISRTNASVLLLENVPRYADTASAWILRYQLRDMGYVTHEAVLSGKDFGALEDRVRWCMVAVTRGMEFSFEDLAPTVRVVRQIGDVLDQNIGPDHESWRKVQYLKDKRERDESKGDGFRMQYVSAESHHIGTLRKGYHKAGSTDPRLRHPTDPELSRLLTAGEHARVKGVPVHLVEGLASTTAHELLGQGIVYEPFRAVGQRIAEHLQALRARLQEGELEQEDSTSEVVRRRERITG
jgi:DNA (cytosine-5)-methyltransferase 1